MRCRPFTVVQVALIIWVFMIMMMWVLMLMMIILIRLTGEVLQLWREPFDREIGSLPSMGKGSEG